MRQIKWRFSLWRHEVAPSMEQLQQMLKANQNEIDALKRRVEYLESTQPMRFAPYRGPTNEQILPGVKWFKIDANDDTQCINS